MDLLKILIAVFLFYKNTFAISIEEESLTLNKSLFTSASIYFGMQMGESWAVDIANKSINNVVKSNNLFFEWTVGSVIRGKSLLEALPVAAKQGAQIGAIGAAIFAPLIWDSTISMYKSCKKTVRPLWDQHIPKEELSTCWDKIITGTIGTGSSVILFIYIKSKLIY